MKILLLNQTFYPDVAATAQYLNDLALRLVERGHQVTVITSRRAYDSPGSKYSKSENWRGIRIIRVPCTGFGKGAKWKRAADFASFLVSCALRVCLVSRQDVIIALTSPPLISLLGAAASKLTGSRFLYWIMDLNPDEAIVAGWLKESSLVARILNGISLYSLRRANAVIVLDRFMRDRVLAKGISRDKVVVVPPWSHDDAIWFDAEGRDRFRAANGLKEKFVVMYSGNHSPCHPLDTLLEAAKCLARDSRIAFCFVGGGSEHQKVKRFAEQNKLQNVVCMPYQPLARLRGSLSAADLHVVVMGNKFVGTIHPCKIYNILSINSPFLYIGPSASHVSDLMADLDNGAYYGHAEHGDVEGIIKAISVIMHKQERGKAESYARVASCFSQERLLPRLVAVAEGRDVEAQQGF